MGKRSSLIIIFLIFLCLHFYVYFHLTYFVFFNFDMPLQAFKIQEFIKSGTFLTAQYFSEESVWHSLAWGPSAVFFYTFFLKIASDPLIVSYLLSTINIIALVAIFLLSWRFFSKKTAVIAVFLLAFNPYWITYVRIIYVPSPLTFFIPISMYLFYEFAYGKKWWAQILLPVSWIALIQIYIPTYSFILTSFIASLFFIKYIKIKYLVIGTILSLILLIPQFNFYINKPEYIKKIVSSPSYFTPPEKTFIERLDKVVNSYIQIPVGGKFDLQMGYSYTEFAEKYLSSVKYFSYGLTTIFVLSIFWNLYFALFKKEYKRLVIFFWAICPLWSLMVLWVTDLLPRYFLIAFPAIAILIALFISDLIKTSVFYWTIPVLLVFYFVVFNISYNNFIRDYDYPKGKLVDVAETPYIYLKKAMDWVVNDSNKRKCNVVLSNNPEKPNFDVWLETKYIWKYIYNRKIDQDNLPTNPCNYIINYRQSPIDLGITDYMTFGLFTAYQYEPSKNQPTQIY